MLDLGVVVATYPEGNTVDLVMEGDGRRIANVQVAVWSGSDKTGHVDLPDVGVPPNADDRWKLNQTRELATRALVDSVRGVPVVVGFLLPQVNQLSFQEKNRRITRHASDVYTTVDDDGNVELFHPNGTYLRIGTSGAHQDLTGLDFDKRWAIARNTDKATHVQLTVCNAGSQVASFNFDPAGNVTLTHTGNLTVNTGGNAAVSVTGSAVVAVGGSASVDVGGTTDLVSAGAVTVEGPTVKLDTPSTTCTGALTVQGLLTFTAGMAGSTGGGGAAATMTGSLLITGGDVQADGIGLKSHHHTEQGDGNATSAAQA